MVHVLAWGSFLFKEMNADDHPRREVYYGRSREGWMRPREMGIESGLWQPIGMDGQNGPTLHRSELRSSEAL